MRLRNGAMNPSSSPGSTPASSFWVASRAWSSEALNQSPGSSYGCSPSFSS